MKTTTFTFRLSPDLESEIARASEEAQVSSSKFVRRAIRNYIKTQK